MSSEDEDMDSEYHPDTPEEAVPEATDPHVLAPVTLSKYKNAYNSFHKWNKLHGATPVTEDVLIKYFLILAEKSKPTTLSAYYTMLKITFRSNDDLDIASYSKLSDFLKNKAAGYKPDKTPVFTEEDIQKFINEAPDEQWLDVKVFCIFGASGAYSSSKLINVMVDHIKQYDNLFLVTIPKTSNSDKFSFTITGTFFNIVKKYADLRPPNPTKDRFFWRYQNGKCRATPIGRTLFSGMPRRIAKYLKLPQPERYLANSFHNRLASISANTNIWMPSSAAGESVEHLLDFETGLLKTSSVSHSGPSVSALTNKNGNMTYNGNSTGYTTSKTKHACTITCFQAQCAAEENEKNALHAFSIFKPSDYDIADISATKFASDPICRWIVAYTHNTEPVSSYNAEETFENITRTTPLNVTVVQKYIRSNSSQLLAAYVVVYGVNCRCRKESSDLFSFSLNQIKCET